MRASCVPRAGATGRHLSDRGRRDYGHRPRAAAVDAARIALAGALELRADDALLLLAGVTDGTDGPTDAAGGLADGGTVKRRARGPLGPAALDDNDSYTFLSAAATCCTRSDQHQLARSLPAIDELMLNELSEAH